jgi:hypothetical protein
MDQNRAKQVQGLLSRIRQDGLTSLRQRQRAAEGRSEEELRSLLDLGGTEATLPQPVGAPVPNPALQEEALPPEQDTLSPRKGSRPFRPAP